MHIRDLGLQANVVEVLEKTGISELRPAQEKAVKAGLLDGKNVLVCTPTASGKTLIGEFAAQRAIAAGGKAVYIVPLVALANEKYKDFRQKYEGTFKVALAVGQLDTAEPRLAEHDLIVCTAEKLDSLLRHHAPWVRSVRCVIVDEIHLLNDLGRGPTLEVLLTLLTTVLKNLQVVALSATIGNPEELASWLKAELVQDSWRPVELRKGVCFDGKVEFE
ncbi:DEAD/DEAH box helicase [Candidatus Woesearchaeota archaeon]|nr:DEAD/DEAH box helicase [Candidatus Woesearchaeota archaeon]